MKNLLLLTVGQVLGQDGPPPPQLGTESLLKIIKILTLFSKLYNFI